MDGSSDRLVIAGDQALAQIAYEYFTYDSEYEVVAFTVEEEYLERERLFGLPVVPFEEVDAEYPPAQYDMFVGVAYNTLNRVRSRLCEEAREMEYTLASYVSSEAFVWRNAEIGENCFVFEDNTIQPWVTIEDDVVLWSGNHIGHHSTIGAHTFVASHVVVSGYVEVGSNCFLGVNATIANNLEIADDCLVGADATILDDTEENAVYGSTMTEPKEYTAHEFFGVGEER